MTAFLMDGQDFDVANGQLSLTEDLSVKTEQRLKTVLRFFKGEWTLDSRLGIPFFEDVLAKQVDFVRVRALVAEAILQDPQVDRLTRLDILFDATSRLATLSFAATLNDLPSIEVTAMPLLRENQ